MIVLSQLSIAVSTDQRWLAAPPGLPRTFSFSLWNGGAKRLRAAARRARSPLFAPNIIPGDHSKAISMHFRCWGEKQVYTMTAAKCLAACRLLPPVVILSGCQMGVKGVLGSRAAQKPFKR